jgi:hypothetical protein
MKRILERQITLNQEEITQAIFAYLRANDINTGDGSNVTFNVTQPAAEKVAHLTCTVEGFTEDELKLE